MSEHDIVLRGGRVIDPETGFDAVADVAITGATISAVVPGGSSDLHGRVEWDVSGRVVSPGFIDLHSHCDDLPSRLLQVCDGVTTALELEAGQRDILGAYARFAECGSPNNFGFSASWALARMDVCGLDVSAGLPSFLANIGAPEWHRVLTDMEHGRLIDALSTQLDAGALGVGILLGYCVETPAQEYLEVATLAAASDVPTFTHVRDTGRPDSGLFGAEEVVTAALSSGAHMHLCHVNSTSVRTIDQVHALLDRARAQGLRVTTEAYPYGSGATGIGAGFLDPRMLESAGLEPTDIVYLPTLERVESAERLEQLRSEDPGGLAIIEFLREERPDDLGFPTRALLHADTAVASDAMPLVPPAGAAAEPDAWPIPAGTKTHPRTAGTFARIFRWYVREMRLLDVAEAVRRCTLVPAQIFEGVSPDMKRKGRVQVGADADIVVFDAESIADRATYASPVETSVGIAHVIVNGVSVVCDGTLEPKALPGRAIRGAATLAGAR